MHHYDESILGACQLPAEIRMLIWLKILEPDTTKPADRVAQRVYDTLKTLYEAHPVLLLECLATWFSNSDDDSIWSKHRSCYYDDGDEEVEEQLAQFRNWAVYDCILLVRYKSEEDLRKSLCENVLRRGIYQVKTAGKWTRDPTADLAISVEPLIRCTFGSYGLYWITGLMRGHVRDATFQELEDEVGTSYKTLIVVEDCWRTESAENNLEERQRRHNLECGPDAIAAVDQHHQMDMVRLILDAMHDFECVQTDDDSFSGTLAFLAPVRWRADPGLLLDEAGGHVMDRKFFQRCIIGQIRIVPKCILEAEINNLEDEMAVLDQRMQKWYGLKFRSVHEERSPNSKRLTTITM